ncbi:MAG TPA: protease modulator HflC [Alcanivorax sp.]|nr:protease modulator HflC [Alcanivorax sp.]
MSTRNWLMLVAVGVLLLLAMDSFYIVNETEKAVLKRFSRVEKTDIEPGIYPKLPLIDEVVRVDGRLLTHDVPSQSFLTSEKKRLMVDAFVTWRIADVQRYIVSVGAGASNGAAMERRARELLDPRVNEALRNQFASRTVQEVVAGVDVEPSGEALDPTTVANGAGGDTALSPEEEARLRVEAAERAGSQAPQEKASAVSEAESGAGNKEDEREELMNTVAEEVNQATLEDLGVEVVDVRVKQVDWPEEVRGRVFDRMRAERARDAAEHRARGREVAERIRAAADRQRTELLAEAYEKAQALRGEGDARATEIYANAYSKDQEFFRFYRSMKAYRESFNEQDDLLILSPDSDFFRYFKQVEEP